jgi:uncharacterized protein (UPF0332 family)
LQQQRITQAQNNIKQYIADGLLKQEKEHTVVFDTFMRNHRESLLVAKKVHDGTLSPLWVVVTSYYSMFYIANAVLYRQGYKVGTKIAHKVTTEALIALVREKIAQHLLTEYELAAKEASELTDTLLEAFENERNKRASFQYETTDTIKNAKAATSLRRAQEFSKEMEKLLM